MKNRNLLEFDSCYLSRKAEGRRQKAEGNSDSCISARDRREQGFKTPTKLKIWWLLFRRGQNPLLNKTLCPLPSAFFNAIGIATTSLPGVFRP